MLSRHQTQLLDDSDEDNLPLPRLAGLHLETGYLSEIDAPYVRYSPAPSSKSGSEISRNGSVSSDHHSVIESLEEDQILTTYLPDFRALCNICLVEFERSQAEQANCITQATAQSGRKYSFECPACRRSIPLRRGPHDQSNGLGHPSLNLFLEPSPRLLPSRLSMRRSQMRSVDYGGSSKAFPAGAVTPRKSPGTSKHTPPARNEREEPISEPFKNEASLEAFPDSGGAFHSAPVSGQIFSSSSSKVAHINADEPHLCLLWNPFKPSISAPRRPRISEQSTPYVQFDTLDRIAADLSPSIHESAAALECEICNRLLVPENPRERGEMTDRPTDNPIAGCRRAPCGHIFHADCLDSLIPSCECQLLAGDIECPACAHPIQLRSQGVDQVVEMMYNPGARIMRAFGSALPGRRSGGVSLRGRFWHDQDLRARIFSSNYSFEAHRWSSKVPCWVDLEYLGFGELLQTMQEKGIITFNAEAIRGPEGLCGHYIIVSSVHGVALRENVLGQAIWGVQRTAEEAKDAAAVKRIGREKLLFAVRGKGHVNLGQPLEGEEYGDNGANEAEEGEDTTDDLYGDGMMKALQPQGEPMGG
ncbi:hypothetical protein M407DRAFT_12100 [Tulasnella calospora MUT 4182]|uniref:RING-type domain-containing protein n=1 Tax=Tulasnella calospora MUT 4182 TaxID=1051891 RepID=A0A0C3PT67_9AGAM|nr:hypothetical protein M407DRAFT_12100 [Tulasnella calospora MUT 4182]